MINAKDDKSDSITLKMENIQSIISQEPKFLKIIYFKTNKNPCICQSGVVLAAAVWQLVIRLAFAFTPIIKIARLQMSNFTDSAYTWDTQFINKHEIKQNNERLQLCSWWHISRWDEAIERNFYVGEQ